MNIHVITTCRTRHVLSRGQLQIALLSSPIISSALLGDAGFVRQIKSAVKAIAVDKRCSVHQMVLAIREGKEGWIQLFGPGECGARVPIRSPDINPAW